MYSHNRLVKEGSGRLGLAEVFDVETAGALASLIEAAAMNNKTTIHICAERTLVIVSLLAIPSDSSQALLLRSQSIRESRGKFNTG